jgi:DNA-binding response OmpR family regulator
MPGPVDPSCVLVVDDEPEIRATVRAALDLEGYRVLEAKDGAEALAVAELGRPCAVLLDMRMPGMDGWAFAREARQRGHVFAIVVMTAAENARRWAAEVAADATLPKPFDIDELFAVVARYCAAD